MYCDSGLGTLGARLGVRGAQQARRRLGERALGGTAQAQGVQATGGRWAQVRVAGEWQQGQERGARGARGSRRCKGARGVRPVRTWVFSAGPGWGFVHSDSVFGPVGLSTDPESLNEHCSLQIIFEIFFLNLIKIK